MAEVEIASILNSVKKKVGLDPETSTEFDADLVDAINSYLNVLTQIGVGPSDGFVIHGSEETWEDFLGTDKRLNMARSYIFVRAKLIFDPPQSSFVLSALQEEEKELVWRLNVAVETP